MLKFVHTADLHLDSPFSGLSSLAPEIAAAMQEATFGAFDYVVGLCLDQEVDFLVVSGDVYDGADRSLRAQLRFRDGLRRLAESGIHTFVAHGNHDPLDGWAAGLEWPEQVTVFPGDRVLTVPFARDGKELAQISGISYPVREVRENLVPMFGRRKAEKIFTIGVLHCNLGSDTGHEPYAPCSLGDLEGAGLDYWALGHVHNHAEYRLEGGALAVYPGNTQGRNIRETGERGAVLVAVEGPAEVKTSFFPTDRVRWEAVAVDTSKVEGLDGLYGAVEEALGRAAEEARGRSLCLRVVLEGRGPLHGLLRRPEELGDLESELRRTWQQASPFVWLDRLQDRTRGTLDLESRRRSGDFVAGLLDRFDSLISGLPDTEAVIRESLNPVFGKKAVSRYLPSPDGDKLRELLERARETCLDYLLAGEDD